MEAPGLEIEAVLEFLRKNGLSESESALMEDIIEKSQLGASDFEMFLFPMLPPPPALKLTSNRRRPLSVASVDDGRSTGSSDEEFVSLGSSTTELCSSEFTNPYGIRTTRPTSQASSDRLSQFGTARDYPDFDMQSDLFWDKENDEDYAMPPLFAGRDSDGDPTEDKYITTVQIERSFTDQLHYSCISGGYTNYLEKGLPLTSVEYVKDEACKDYYDLNEDYRLEQSDEKHEEHCKHLKVVNANDVHHSRGETVASNTNFTQRNSTYDSVGGFNNTPDFHILVTTKDNHSNEHDNYEINNNEVIVGESHESEAAADEDGAVISDELLIYENVEDDYEIFDLRIIHRKNRTGFEENKDLPIVLNSVIAGRYYVTEYLGSAAFSKVVQACDLHSGMDVCLKIIKNDKDFFDQSLDEIKLLKYVNKHDPADEHHILRLYDYFYHQEHLFIVTELLRANLYEFQKYNQESGGEPYFTLQRLQVITRQCLEALAYLHDLGIIHCDLKPENILIKSYGRCEIKVIDLGSSCFQKDNLSLYVQSRSYRAPEVILGLSYDQKIDLWSLGCILAELCSGEVLFPNEAIPMLLARIVGTLGPIDMDMLQRGHETHKYFTKEYDLYLINEETDQLEYIIPEETLLEHQLQVSDSGFIEFLLYLLETNPKRRPTAKQALEHSWLSQSYAVNPF
ncbi:LAMMER dual specificity kinase [Olea europaea subsp. europaea]|uniref:LAMMER dual specificity kinase n=2 Tax=Olea europaea subsp. europaea TaxID=158383 RepID=A0A8S0R778_OLEEU|nr:LAMMER dual specificity kinase [Olea europaea subsp. europaea]